MSSPALDHQQPLYGIVAEFDEPEPLMHAARKAREAGYRRMEAYVPFPVEGLAEALALPKDQVPLITLIGGVCGGLTGYLMQWYSNVIDYPINIGGKPYHSWPAFIPITFELTVLFAALSAAFGMLAMNRLPRLHHPIFDSPGFARASKDRFFLCIEARDPLFDRARTSGFLSSLQAMSVREVTHEC
jgi:hypothetical protein